MKKWKNWRESLGKYQYALLVMAVGALLLLWPSGGEKEMPRPEGERPAVELEASELEGRLERALSSIRGAGKTRVVLTVDSGSRKILARDREEQERGSSSAVVTVGQGSGRQEAIPLQTVAPVYRGALVVSPGAEDPSVRLALVEAVSALTGLGADQIAVCTGVE